MEQQQRVSFVFTISSCPRPIANRPLRVSLSLSALLWLLVSFRWGLVPSFTKKGDKPNFFRMFNARSETVSGIWRTTIWGGTCSEDFPHMVLERRGGGGEGGGGGVNSPYRAGRSITTRFHVNIPVQYVPFVPEMIPKRRCHNLE